MPDTPLPKPTNNLLLKVIIGLLSISGTLMSIIGISIMSSIKDLQRDVRGLTPISAEHTVQIKSLADDVFTLKGDVRGLADFRATFSALYALKPDEIVIKRRRTNN